MKRISIYLAVVSCSLLVLSSCKTDPQKVEQKAMIKEIMAIHDEVMPKMGEVVKLSGELDDMKINLTNSGKGFKVSDIGDLLDNVKALNAADEGMYDWMDQWKKGKSKRSGDVPHEQVMSYLKEEKKKVTRVRDNIEAGLEMGQQLKDRLK